MSGIRTHTTLVVVGTDICSYKSINHMIMAALILMVSIFFRTLSCTLFDLPKVDVILCTTVQRVTLIDNAIWCDFSCDLNSCKFDLHFTNWSTYSFFFQIPFIRIHCNSKTLHLRYMFFTDKMTLELLNFDIFFSIY